MKWSEYSALALRTESIPENYYAKINPKVGYPVGLQEWKPHEDATRLLHAAMGLVTETDELTNFMDRINLVEEIGDCFWYLPIIESIFPDLNLHLTVESEVGPSSAYNNLKAMQGMAALLIDKIGKRHIFYGKELEVQEIKDAIRTYAYRLRHYCEAMDVDPSEAWEANIKKLEKRYPGLRFNGEHAINRNVANELSHIEMNEELKSKDVAYSEGEADLATMWEDNLRSNWDKLKLGVATELPYNADPDDVANEVLSLLRCTEEEARTILGEEFERCRFTIATDASRADEFGDFWILTAYPIKFSSREPTLESALINIMDPVTPPSSPLQFNSFPVNQVDLPRAGFNSLLRNELTPNQIERVAMGLAFELSQKFKKDGMDALATAMGDVYRTYSGRGDKLSDFSVVGMYELLGYPMTIEGILTVTHSILKEPRDASNNSSAG